MIASNQPDDRLTGTAHTQLSLLETSLIAYGNAVAAYGVASSAADSKAKSVASDNETKARKKVKRIEDLAKTELADRRKIPPDACPTSLLASSCIEDIVTVYLGEGFERCFFHIITNYNSLPAPPSTMRKSVNILQAPYMVRDAVELLEDQGSYRDHRDHRAIPSNCSESARFRGHKNDKTIASAACWLGPHPTPVFKKSCAVRPRSSCVGGGYKMGGGCIE